MVTTIYIKKEDEETWKAFIKKYRFEKGFSPKLMELVKDDLKKKQ